jgi:hypothetical protein
MIEYFQVGHNMVEYFQVERSQVEYFRVEHNLDVSNFVDNIFLVQNRLFRMQSNKFRKPPFLHHMLRSIAT